MGFLSGLLGGGSSSSSSGGFNALPPQIRDAYTQFGTAVQGQIPSALNAYKPLAQTGDETRAFDILRQGFSPTEESLKRDVGMLMNPFDQFVLNDVNRAANSDFSILKQNANQAGQFGSNRQQLGANDIEQTRLGTIGKLRQGQYNSAIDQIFNGLLPARAADAAGLMSIGNFQRGLDTQTNTAAITGLQELAKALGILPTQEGSTTSTSKSSGGIGGLGGIISGIGGLFG